MAPKPEDEKKTGTDSPDTLKEGDKTPLAAQPAPLDISQLTPGQLEQLRAALFPQTGQLLEAQPLQAWPPEPAPVQMTTEVAPHGTITQVIG